MILRSTLPLGDYAGATQAHTYTQFTILVTETHGFVALNPTRLEIGDGFCEMRRLEDSPTADCAKPSRAANMYSE